MMNLKSFSLCLCVSTVLLVVVAAFPSVRYLHGRLLVDDNSFTRNKKKILLETQRNTTVSNAWRHCQENPECISFGFQASERFPGNRVAISFYSVADWHVTNNDANQPPVFVIEDSWHLYVNATREKSMLKQEIDVILSRLRPPHMSKGSSDGALSRNNLRIKPSEDANRAQDTMSSIVGIFNMVQYKDLRLPCCEWITRPVLRIAMDDYEIEDIRVVALQVLLAITDSYETPPLLEEKFGLLSYMESIIRQQMKHEKTNGEWSPVAKVALDIVSNMALHQTEEFPFRPTRKLLDSLQKLASESDAAVGLQATLALIHAGSSGSSGQHIPLEKLVALVDLLEATIDGDRVFGYDWELIPGPLSAIQTLIQSKMRATTSGDQDASTAVVDKLLAAGLLEQLVRILEAKCLDAEVTLAALQVMDNIRTFSPNADEMVAMAASSIYSVRDRLERYEAPVGLARALAREVTNHKFHEGSTLEKNEL